MSKVALKLKKIRCTNATVHTLQKGVQVGFHKLAIYHYHIICFIYWLNNVF